MNLNKEYIENIIKEKKMGVIAILVILVIGGIAIYFGIQDTLSYEKIDDTSDLEIYSNETQEVEEKIKVYVTGEVVNPGVIELNVGDRIEDAIKAAGGTTDSANLEKVNLAYKLEDGQKPYIPNINEKEEVVILSTENGENVVKDVEKSNGKIDINNAKIDKLCEIPGVGETLAKRIVDYRDQNGKFKNIEDLKNVSGIGEKKFESIKEYIALK